MTLATLLIIGLAVWRVAYMVTKESGAFGVFYRFRAVLERRYKKADTHGTLYELFSCPYCLSVWLAVIGWLAWQHPAGQVVLQALAIAAVAAIVQKYGGFDFSQ